MGCCFSCRHIAQDIGGPGPAVRFEEATLCKCMLLVNYAQLRVQRPLEDKLLYKVVSREVKLQVAVNYVLGAFNGRR